MKSTGFLCLALMIKYLLKTMDVIHLLVVIQVNYKKPIILITIQIILIFSFVRTAFSSSVLF